MYFTAEQFEARMPDASRLLSDEPEMDSSLHFSQLDLLVSSLTWHWQDRDDFFIGADLTIYFSRQQLKNRKFRGPDFFLVKSTTRKHRASWVTWEEDGQYPHLIIELMSNSAASEDRTLKKNLYQDRFRTPEFFWFSPESMEFEGFRLVGHLYEPIPINEQGWRWSQELGLFLGIYNEQLRYFSPDGILVPTPSEAANTAIEQTNLEAQRANAEAQRANAEAQRANAEAQRANAEAQRANAEAQRANAEAHRADAEVHRADAEARRAEKLAEKLRSLGIDPD